MIEELGTVTLKNGDAMAVKVVTPPAAEYAERLGHFLEHKGDYSLRCIRQRLRGDYAAFCVDKYFLGEIHGRIAGQIWYGYATAGTGIANFGHVYTEPEHRKKGIADELMKVFKAAFDASPVHAALCGTGTPWVARMYFRYGFQPVVQGAETGPLVLFKEGRGRGFRAFEEEYFRPGQDVAVLPGTMAYRHDIDKMLKNALLIRNKQSKRVAMASRVATYQDACFLVEDGRGLVAVARAARGSVVGWSFCLNTGSPWEARANAFDFEIHPYYAGAAGTLVRESLNLAKSAGITQAYSYCPARDGEKIGVVAEQGFCEVARLEGYLEIDQEASDLVVLRRTLNAQPEEPIVLRGEHLSNLRRYVVEGARLQWDEARGYSAEFARRHDDVLERIVRSPGRKVRIVATTDDICNCGACPKMRDHCVSAELAERDRAVAGRFGLAVDREYEAEEVVARVSRRAEPTARA